MKKQTWNRVGVLLLCLMLFIPTCGLTDNIVSDNLYRFKLAVVDKQAHTSFLTVWDNVGKQQLMYISLLLCESRYLWCVLHIQVCGAQHFICPKMDVQPVP